MTYARRRTRGIASPVGTCVGRVLGKDLTEWHLSTCSGFIVELTEIGADEATDKCSSDVVRMALDHESKVEDAGDGKVEVCETIGQEDTCYDGSAGGAEAATEGDLVVNANGDALREEHSAMAAEDVEGDAGGEVLVGIERNIICTLAGIGDGGEGGTCVGDDDVEGEVEGEGEADDVEAWANVGGSSGNTDGEGARHDDEKLRRRDIR